MGEGVQEGEREKRGRAFFDRINGMDRIGIEDLTVVSVAGSGDPATAKHPCLRSSRWHEHLAHDSAHIDGLETLRS